MLILLQNIKKIYVKLNMCFLILKELKLKCLKMKFYNHQNYFPIQYLTTLVFISAIVFGQQIAYKKWIIRED